MNPNINPHCRLLKEIAYMIFNTHHTIRCHKRVILVFVLHGIGMHHLKTTDAVEQRINYA